MTKRWLLNLGMATLLVALGLLLWLRPGAVSKPATTTLAMPAPTTVKTIRIDQPKQKTAMFRRTDDGWQMLQPVNARADATVIQRWLESARETVTRSYPAKSLDLAQFGLKPPRLSLTLNDQKLEFGSFAPVGHERYIRRDDTVYLVNDMLFYQLHGDPLSFLSKRLLPTGATIQKIALPDIEISRSGNKQWQLSPSRPEATSDQIQKLIHAWRHAQAFNVKRTDAQADVSGRVVIRLKGREKPIRFQVLKNASLLALARPDLGVEYQLPANQRNELLTVQPDRASTTSR